MLGSPKMGSQMVDGNPHIQVIYHRTVRNSLNAGSRSLFVGVQRPDQVVGILALVPFVDGEGFWAPVGSGAVFTTGYPSACASSFPCLTCIARSWEMCHEAASHER